jgi:peptidoglycan/LPS O-acetylase OafA/YrhL
MPGVDGLRALAVAAVVIYHLGASWLPGGFLGVDVFLVISGYLITSLLLAEFRQTGRIGLKRFWLRRARRLLPALFLMIVVVLVAMVLLHPGEVGRLHGALLASFGYVANWYFAFADVPYFEQFGRPSVLQHLWSLAVEEQFYLLWPPIMAVCIGAFGRRRLLVGVGAGIVGSTILAWVLWEPFTDPSRIYYGTDTRAVGLLAGVALAFLWPANRLRPLAAARPRLVLESVGIVALVGLLALMLTLGDLDEMLYKGGFLLVAITTAAVIAVVAHPSSLLGKAFGLSVIVWLGVRSYGIYLWHWPVLMLTRPNQDVPFDGAPLVVLQLVLMLGAAALSYQYVERPIRRHGLAGIRDALRRWNVSPRRPVRLAAPTAAVALVALGFAVALLPRDTTTIPGLSGAASAAQQTSARLDDPRQPGPQPAGAERPAPPAVRRAGKVLAVGDSVMLGASPALQRALGSRAVIDAAVSRQFAVGAGIIDQGLVRLKPDTVVVHLGNNGYVPFDELEALMKRLRGTQRVVLVNVRVPLQWQDSVNDALDYAASRYDNTVLVDWNEVSDRPGLLADGAHMTTEGARLYARAIARAVRAP